MKYKLSDIAKVAEIISAIAIVLSLVFVGVQLNDNTRATRSAIASKTVSTLEAWYVGIGTSPQTSALFYNAMANPEDQTPQEWYRFVMMVHGLMINYQNSYYLVQQGTLDEATHKTMTDTLHSVKDQPGFQLYWQQRGSIFFKDFQDYVNEIMTSDRNVPQGVYPQQKSD